MKALPLAIVHWTWVCILFGGGLTAQERNPDSKKVVLLRDGSSWYFDEITSKTISELQALAEGSYDLVLEEVNAEGDMAALSSRLQAALQEDGVDLILASGYLATELAIQLSDEERTRPILGSAVEFSDSLETAISSSGTSTIKNYSFITNPLRIASDLEALSDLAETDQVYALVDRRLFSEIDQDEVYAIKSRLEAKYQIRIDLLRVGESPGEILAAIPGDARAVYASILPRVAPEARKVLFQRMAERGLLTLSMVGLPDVELGALAGLAPDNRDSIAKRSALNAHQI
ncbi:MAG: hypothetical protein AAGJ31_10180, partial [Verrucomicrobiota bacterium]